MLLIAVTSCEVYLVSEQDYSSPATTSMTVSYDLPVLQIKPVLSIGYVHRVSQFI